MSYLNVIISNINFWFSFQKYYEAQMSRKPEGNFVLMFAEMIVLD